MSSPGLKLRDRVHNQLEHWRYKFGPKIVDALVAASTWQAQAKLKSSAPVSMLIDNNVLGHGVTHESGWIDTGVSMCGGHAIKTGYAARIPVYADGDTSAAYRNICMLPAIVHLARKGLIEIKTSGELKAEQFHQPMGRFRGYGYFDFSLFGGLDIPSVDGLAFPTLGAAQLNLPSARAQQLARIEAKADPLYRSLKAELGEKNSLDAWHIRTAEVHGLAYFLTMDFKLLRALEHCTKKEPFTSLKTKIVTPLMLGAIYDLMAIAPKFYSYHGASFKVRPDLYWPNGKRNPPRKHAREPGVRIGANVHDDG